jgi:hypothetical protein
LFFDVPAWGKTDDYEREHDYDYENECLLNQLAEYQRFCRVGNRKS